MTHGSAAGSRASVGVAAAQKADGGWSAPAADGPTARALGSSGTAVP